MFPCEAIRYRLRQINFFQNRKSAATSCSPTDHCHLAFILILEGSAILTICAGLLAPYHPLASVEGEWEKHKGAVSHHYTMTFAVRLSSSKHDYDLKIATASW